MSRLAMAACTKRSFAKAWVPKAARLGAPCLSISSVDQEFLIVDGAAGLENAIATVWNGVETQGPPFWSHLRRSDALCELLRQCRCRHSVEAAYEACCFKFYADQPASPFRSRSSASDFAVNERQSAQVR
jgi:hypothetical protein